MVISSTRYPLLQHADVISHRRSTRVLKGDRLKDRLFYSSYRNGFSGRHGGVARIAQHKAIILKGETDWQNKVSKKIES